MSKTSNKFSPEVRDRAVRMVGEHRSDHASDWAALTSIAGKIGCTTETLRRWCREEASRRGAPAAQSPYDKARLRISPGATMNSAPALIAASRLATSITVPAPTIAPSACFIAAIA